MADALFDRPPAGAWSVSALVGAIAEVLAQGFAACTVVGEIVGFSRASSGHCYLGLKDPNTGATLRCAMFRRAASLLDFTPADGQAVELRGRVAIYEPRGELQFVVEAMRRSGVGVLYERFLRLRDRLQADGFFDAAHKRPLPAHPRTVGVVTSLAGAALHDIVTTISRRSPHVAIVIYPSPVQGAEAAAALCAAIALAAARGEVDALIVARGGGSLEDLWAFNDERVVRAVRAARLPVLSGIGHETDLTLTDLAADVRAATPTAAAELVAPVNAVLQQALDALQVALGRRIAAGFEQQAQRLDRLALRLARPSELLGRQAQTLGGIAARMMAARRRVAHDDGAAIEIVDARLHRALLLARAQAAARLERASLRLEAVDPYRVLARGYALLARASGQPVQSVGALAVGTEIVARLHDGEATMTTIAIAPAAPALRAR